MSKAKFRVGDRVKIYGTDIVGKVTHLNPQKFEPEYWVSYTKDYVYHVEQWPEPWLELIPQECDCGAKKAGSPGHSHWCSAEVRR